MKSNKNLIGIVASSGGHLTQLMQLSNSWRGYQCFYVSTANSTIPVFEGKGNFYIIEDSTRETIITNLKNILTTLKIIHKEKPLVIISGGSGCGSLFCIIGKFFGAKTVWLDSVANSEKISLSGRFTRPFIDLFIVQWKHHVKKYKNVNYWGKVI